MKSVGLSIKHKGRKAEH